MEEEMASMKTNQVWDLVDLPEGHNAIGNKWVHRIKRSADGKPTQRKSRLVAKGFSQIE